MGFALTLLQRRLASSPEAIYQSLRRRRERLQSRLRELELLRRGGKAPSRNALARVELDADELEDLEDLPADEQEETADEILDQATAARSVVELKAEISILRHMEGVALAVRRSGKEWPSGESSPACLARSSPPAPGGLRLPGTSRRRSW